MRCLYLSIRLGVECDYNILNDNGSLNPGGERLIRVSHVMYVHIRRVSQGRTSIGSVHNQ